MANTKISQLTELSAASIDDLLVIVDDPSGTPVTKKITEKSLTNSRKLMSIVAAGNFSMTAGTSAQPVFASTGDVFTLEGSTTYEFEAQLFITKSGTTCTTAFGIALGGGASITSMKYIARVQNSAKNTTGTADNIIWVDTNTATVLNATTTGDNAIYIKGILRTNAGGTFTPQITFSATPTSPVMVADSFMKFIKVGTSSENTIGSVA